MKSWYKRIGLILLFLVMVILVTQCAKQQKKEEPLHQNLKAETKQIDVTNEPTQAYGNEVTKDPKKSKDQDGNQNPTATNSAKDPSSSKDEFIASKKPEPTKSAETKNAEVTKKPEATITVKVTPLPTKTPELENIAKATPLPTKTPESENIVKATPLPTKKPEATKSAKATPLPSNKPTEATPVPSIQPTSVPSKPEFSGKAYVLLEVDSGKIIASKNESKRLYPASTIKLLTALTALEHASLKEEITARQEALDLVDSDVTRLGVVAGTTHSLAVWLNMLLISSYGDAANTIADSLGEGSMDKFITWMNDKAKSLDMNNTKVDNAIGLDIGNGFQQMYSTAEDIGKLALASMKSDTIRNIVKKKSYRIPKTSTMEEITIRNTNHFLRSDTYESTVFDVIGTKTGHTEAAGYCLVATAVDSKGRELICVYLGGAQRSVMYQEIKAMFEYYFQRIK